MTEPNQDCIRPMRDTIGKLITDAYYAGKADGRKELLKELEENIELHYPALAEDEFNRVRIYLNKWAEIF